MVRHRRGLIGEHSAVSRRDDLNVDRDVGQVSCAPVRTMASASSGALALPATVMIGMLLAGPSRSGPAPNA
jgi:hypothetical protein